MKRLELNVGFACNNNCKFCISGNNKRELADRETILRHLEAYSKRNIDTLNILGGEATIVPGIVDIVKHAKSLGFKDIRLITNGRRLSNYAFVEELVKAGVNFFNVALQGHTASVHDSLTQQKGSFEETVQGLKNIIELRKKHKEIRVTTSTAVNRENYLYLPDMVRFFSTIGTSELHLVGLRPEGNCEKYPEVVPRYSEIRPYLRKAVDWCMKHEVPVSFSEFPLCLMPEHQIFSDESLKDADEVMQITSRTSFDWVASRKSLKTKAPFCAQCVKNGSCEGVWKSYVAIAGFDGLQPIQKDILVSGQKKEERNFGYLKISRRCMNDCIFCSQPKYEFDMPIDEIKNKIACLKKEGINEIIFTGGEPTLNKDLPAAIHLTKDMGLECRIITNGINLSNAAYVRKLACAGLDRVVLSVHSHIRNINEELSRNAGSFELVLKGIENALAANMYLSFNITLNSKNVAHLPELVLFLIGKYPQVEHFVFNNLDPTGKALENKEILAKLGDIELKLAETLSILIRNKKTFRVERVPLCYMAGYEQFSSETRRIVKSQRYTVVEPQEGNTVQREVFDFKKTKSSACSPCFLKGMCAGLEPKYAEMFGTGELYPAFTNPKEVILKILGNKHAQQIKEKRREAQKVEHGIEVLVFELTRRCDLSCLFCPTREKKSLDTALFEGLLEDNSRLQTPVPRVELGGCGNPMLHKDILRVFELLNKHGAVTTIVTNGYNLKDILRRLEPGVLDRTHFCLYLDSPIKELNDRLMGVRAFDRTLGAMEYLKKTGLSFDILMRVTPLNYDQIPQMLRLSKQLGAGLLLPMEIFPLSGHNEFTLSDVQKAEVTATIEKLRSAGEPVFKNIHFEMPEGDCTYIRKKRLFINSGNSLSFCHFLSCLKNSEITKTSGKGFLELLYANDRIRTSFQIKKREELHTWQPGRKTSSPCSFCINCHRIACAW